MNRRNLLQRVLFAAVAAPVAWVLINLNISVIPPRVASALFGSTSITIYPGQVLAVVLIFLACSEYLRMLSLSFPRNGFWLVYVWLAVQSASHMLPQSALAPLDAFGEYDMYMLLVVVAAESVAWGRHSSRWKRASLLFSGMVFLSYAGLSLVNYYREPFQTIFPVRSPMLVSQLGIITVLASVFLCDTAAYFAGSLWGRRHFSSISPNKTIEGALAGLLAAIVVSSVGWYFFADRRYAMVLGPIMGLLIGVAGQAGDLLVSLMKRYFQVKDASNLIPGHGGVLDRFDSLFFTAPILNLFFIAVVKFA
jgi:phosphatidate cytidylyltransferase